MFPQPPPGPRASHICIPLDQCWVCHFYPVVSSSNSFWNASALMSASLSHKPQEGLYFAFGVESCFPHMWDSKMTSSFFPPDLKIVFPNSPSPFSKALLLEPTTAKNWHVHPGSLAQGLSLSQAPSQFFWT